MEQGYKVDWPHRQLIINADDYGCCPSISQGIL